MMIELHCLVCRSEFSAAGETPADDILNRMIEEGPWYALAPGETFADMVQTAISGRGRILCPDCGKALTIRQRGWYRSGRELVPCV